MFSSADTIWVLQMCIRDRDIMVRGRGDSVRPLGDHAGLGDIPHDLGPGQVAADAGFCALPHLDLDGRARFQIILIYAKAAGGDLNDGMGAILITIFVQPALAGIVISAQRCV